ncbi:hypothetical protein Taro_043380 [Colocasia esculenta]|uniref:Uncharacterized protein n=1 Tax=Colocasia esculenta TaxID=4460 RepID=A0A843WVL4_COLES|nr:hypothetical protein [Colocasia esculenta]
MFYFPHFSLVAGGVTFPYWVSFLRLTPFPFSLVAGGVTFPYWVSFLRLTPFPFRWVFVDSRSTRV